MVIDKFRHLATRVWVDTIKFGDRRRVVSNRECSRVRALMSKDFLIALLTAGL